MDEVSECLPRESGVCTWQLQGGFSSLLVLRSLRVYLVNALFASEPLAPPLFIPCALPLQQDLLQIRSYVYAEEPNIDIHNFLGTFTRVSEAESSLRVCSPDSVQGCTLLCLSEVLYQSLTLKANTGFSVGTAQLECSPGSELEF